MNVRKIVSLAAVYILTACTQVYVFYDQSKDDLRSSPDKFRGKIVIALPMDKFLNNLYLSTQHCNEYPQYVISPDRRAMTATAAYMGMTALAYQVVIDAKADGETVEISYWTQSEMWGRRAASWIEQMKNPETCLSK